MQFASDNWTGVAPQILDAIAKANHGQAQPYGDDDLTKSVEGKISEIFERDCAVYLVATGGAANGLALSALTPPYGAILCHEESHIQMDECAGPEFFTGGAKLITMKGDAGKITPTALEDVINGFPHRPPHGAPLTTLSLTQATECGTVYSPKELIALSDVARRHDLKVHMDGARFANAVAHLNVPPADVTWRAGVDVLCFGGTKNGCLAAEAVVFFNPDDAKDFEFRRKRAGHLWSKMRFIAAQFDAYLNDDLWLQLARHANEMAARLSDGLAQMDGAEITYRTDANEVFASMSPPVADALRTAGASFYPWVTPGAPASKNVHRLVTAFDTQTADVDECIQIASRATKS